MIQKHIPSQVLKIILKNSNSFQKSYKFITQETTAISTWLNVLSTMLLSVLSVLWSSKKEAVILASNKGNLRRRNILLF